MSIQAPLIQSDVNNDNNTTRIMEVDTLYANIISDGIADIENGYISNLIEPTSNNEIATKYYVDHSSGGGGGAAGPNGSVQYNDGTGFGGSANLTLTNPGLPNATLNIGGGGTLTNGVMSLTGSQFSGLTNPTNSQEAATKSYVDETVSKLGVITINVVYNASTAYTPTQVYNNIINLTEIPNNVTGLCAFDTFPTATDMKTFLGSDFQVGKSWTTIFRAPQISNQLFVRFIGGNPPSCILSPINYLLCGLPLPVFALANYSVATLVSVITNITSGSETYYTYLTSNFVDLTTDAQITDRGVLTPSMGSGSVLSNGTVIYPIPANPSINSSSPVTYTYANLQQFLIIRTGLTADTIDTFVSATDIVANSDFIMGGGTFRFFVQNPTAFNLALSPGTGWSYQTGNTGLIPAGYCGAFWVSVTISPPSCLIYSVGTNPING
jgi:hypothetical protein